MGGTAKCNSGEGSMHEVRTFLPRSSCKLTDMLFSDFFFVLYLLCSRVETCSLIIPSRNEASSEESGGWHHI